MATKPNRGSFSKDNPRPGPGRPKLPDDIKDLQEACRKLTPVALNCLEYWANNRKSAAGIRASEILLERGHGKALQNLQVAHSGSIEHKHEHFVITASAEWLSGLIGEQPALENKTE